MWYNLFTKLIYKIKWFFLLKKIIIKNKLTYVQNLIYFPLAYKINWQNDFLDFIDMNIQNNKIKNNNLI